MVIGLISLEKFTNTAIEVKDIYTEGHARRVMDYREKLSRTFNLAQSEIEKIKTAALLHDERPSCL